MESASQQLEPAPGYAAAIEFLLGRVNFEKTGHKPYSIKNYKLDRMRLLLQSLGDPQKRLPTIHIAGTKGKGSTANYLSEILRAAGFRVGLFTSPHFLQLEERFTVDGKFCPPELLVQLVQQMQACEQILVEQTGENATFFDLSTALAWLYFAHQQVDVVVLEVGLGGRLDSTNVCSPILTIITSISLDHQAQLGNTIALIAGEKAGIIKGNVPVLCGARHPDAVQVIEQIAHASKAPLRKIGYHFDAQWRLQSPVTQPDSLAATPPHSATFNPPRLLGEIDYRETSPPFSIEQLKLGMPGRHQADNAAVALAAGRWLIELGWQIETSHLQAGLANAFARGRFELVGTAPPRIIDTAHNEASITSLIETMQDYFPNYRRVVIFAASRDKDLPVMLKALIAAADILILTQYRENPRAFPVAQLQELVADLVATGQVSSQKKMLAHTLIAKDPAEAYEMGLQLCGPDDLLCATGSFFLAAELFPIIGLRRFEKLTENERINDGEP